MDRRRPLARAIAGSLALGIVVGAEFGRAQTVDGRYLGSFVHTDGPVDDSAIRQRYDAGIQQATPGGLSLDLRMSLAHQFQPWEAETALLRSRFYGDLRGPVWRLRGQWVPWQDISPASIAPRESNGQLGFDLTPRGAPRFSLDYSRLERDINGVRSNSEDRRALLSYEWRGLSASTRFRRIDNKSQDSAAAAARTDEWRGTLMGTRAWRNVDAQLAYNVLSSQSRIAERRRDLLTHQVDLDANWRLARRFTVGGSGLQRWGETRDNEAVGSAPIDELSLSGRADYRPVDPVQLQVLREYRRQVYSTGTSLSDYVRFQAIFRRPITQGMTFQSGVLQTVDLASVSGDVPNSSVYALVDGRLRRHAEAHAEVRASRAPGGVDRGTQWQQVVQLRTFPNRASRFEVLYRHDVLPPVDGRIQRDGMWDFTLGYDPSPELNLVGGYRLQDGSGRIVRLERLATATLTWRTGRRTSVGGHWSNRRSNIEVLRTYESVAGGDITFYMPRDWRVHGSADAVSGNSRPDLMSYNITLEKVF